MQKKYLYLFSSFVVLFLVWFISGIIIERYQNSNIPDIKNFRKPVKVEIKSKNYSINLFLSNSNWYISPQNYLLDEEISIKLFDLLSNFSIVDMVGKSENLSSYQLDEDKKIVLKIKQNGKEQELFLGKTATTKKHTYLMIPDNENIYLAKGDFSFLADKNYSDFRSKKILSLNTNEITSISWREGGKNYSFINDNGKFKASWKKEDISERKFMDFYLVLTTLSAIDFPNKIPPKPVLRTLNIKTLSSNYNLIIFDKDENGDYFVKVEGKNENYKITEFAGNILLKSYTNY